ncbi:hypothetical protein LXL04_027746 [Taraxacum kok-saghyz]
MNLATKLFLHDSLVLHQVINRMELRQLLESESYKNVDHLLLYPQEGDIMPKQLTTIGKPVWVSGNVKLPYREQSFTQTSCASCLKKIEADISWFHIVYHLIGRSRATFEIDDDTGSMTTPTIDKFITLNPLAIKDVEDNGQYVGEMIGSSIFKVNAVAFIRSYKSKQHQQATTRYFIKYLSLNKSPSPKLKPKRIESNTDTPNEIGSSSSISQRTTKRIK